MSSLESVISIADKFNTLAEAISRGQDIYDLVTGTEGGMNAVLDDLNNIYSAITQGLQEVVNAINDANYTSQWESFVNQLNAIQEVYLPLAQQLATAEQSPTGAWLVTQDTVKMPLIQWCEIGLGPDLPHGSLATGAIATLGAQLTNLASLFGVGAGAADPTMLGLWQSVCGAGAAANMNGFVGQTQYTLTFSFMQQIFSMVGILAYTHDAALAAYLKENPSNPHNFVSIQTQVADSIGQYNSVNTCVWQAFNNALNSMITSAEPSAQYGFCVTTGDNGSNKNISHNYQQLASGGQMVQINTPVLAPAGSYLGGFVLGQYSSNGDQVAYLQALPVTVGANLALTPGSWINPTSNNCTNWGNGTSDGGGSLYINTSYCTPPAQTQADTFTVVTGATLTIVGNRIALNVQFSALNLHDPSNPTVTNPQWVCADPQPNSYFATMGWDNWQVNIDYLDLRPSGTTDGFPVSNLALVQADPVGDGSGTGNRIGLAAQNALPLHTLSWLQPASVFVNTLPTT